MIVIDAGATHAGGEPAGPGDAGSRGDITARRLGAESRGGLLDFLEDALEGVHLRLHVVQLGGYLA